MEFSVKLGKRIKELRGKRGMSQEQLAELAGISGKYLGEVERGEVNVSVMILTKLADVVQVHLPELLALEHHAARQELQAEMHLMLVNADERELRLAYRLLRSIFY